jgi:hypothetical protein
MSQADFINFHVLLPGLGLLVSSAMALHGLELAKQGKWWRVIWGVACSLIFLGVMIDGAKEHHDSRTAEKLHNDSERELQRKADLSLANEDALKKQLLALSQRAVLSTSGDIAGIVPARPSAPRPGKVKPTAPKISQKPQVPAPAQTPIPLPANLHLAQENISSTNSKYPYELRVIVQTDATIHHPDLALMCDGSVKDFDFFIVGQAESVMMDVRSGALAGHCGIRATFGFPDFTPDSPLAFLIYSDTPTKVVGIVDATGHPWTPP